MSFLKDMTVTNYPVKSRKKIDEKTPQIDEKTPQIDEKTPDT